jgi:hypothetical protein
VSASDDVRNVTIGVAPPQPPGGRAVAGGHRADRRGGRARRTREALVLGAWVLGVLAAFAAYLRLSETRAVNSDGAAQALQAWDMLHGNVPLRGWTTSDVSFYTTELPQYLLIELVRGLGQDVVHVAAAMTYTLVVLLAALVAKGTATGREATVRVALAVGIMLAPQLDSGTNVLLSSPDHLGTAVPLLTAWLFLDRSRLRWLVPVVVSTLLAWALVADSIVGVAGVIPLVLVCGLRVAREIADSGLSLQARLRPRRLEIALGGGAVVAVGVAAVAGRVIRALGGYTVRPLNTQLAPLGEIMGHNLPIAARCLLLLPGADFLGLPASPATFFVALHLAGVAAAAAGIALAARRPLVARRPLAGGRAFAGRGSASRESATRESYGDEDLAGDLVSQVLLVGIVVSLLAFVVSRHVYAVSSAREIAPVLPYAAALAGRQLACHLAVLKRSIAVPALRLVLVLVLAGYLAGLGLELTAPAAAPQQARLAGWLESHRLGSGLSGYWEASIVTLTSGNRVAVRPVTVTGGRIVAAASEVRASWYDPKRSTADFVVLFPGADGYPGFTQRQAVLATFGEPARRYRVGRYTIWCWHRNLLASLPAPR